MKICRNRGREQKNNLLKMKFGTSDACGNQQPSRNILSKTIKSNSSRTIRKTHILAFFDRMKKFCAKWSQSMTGATVGTIVHFWIVHLIVHFWIVRRKNEPGPAFFFSWIWHDAWKSQTKNRLRITVFQTSFSKYFVKMFISIHFNMFQFISIQDIIACRTEFVSRTWVTC